MERKLLQIAFALAGLVLGAVPRLMAVIGHGVPTIGILVSLTGELIVAPLLWLWHQHVVRVSQRAAVT